MENESNSNIVPKNIFKFIGVGFSMCWFLNYFEYSINIILQQVFVYFPIPLNYSIVYPFSEIFSLEVILFLFLKIVKNIKKNHQNESYLQKMIVLFVIGILFLEVFSIAFPFLTIDFLMNNFDVNSCYMESYTIYVKLITDILTFTIKLIVLAYVFLKNRNFQNSSASS